MTCWRAAGGEVATQDLHSGGLAGTVGAEETQHLALADSEADVAHRFQVSVAARETFHFHENITAHGALCSAGRVGAGMGRH